MAKSKQPRRQKLIWEDLSWEARRNYLESFVGGFKQFLESPEKEEDDDDSLDTERRGRKQIMDALKVDVRQFDLFLRRLYEGGYLRLGCHRLTDRAKELKAKFHDELEEVTVVAGSDEGRFAQAAAEDFIKCMVQIGTQKKAKNANAFLNVGIVSGNTTGSVIRAAMNMNWPKDLVGVNVANLPPIRVFALNVCLTEPKHLPGNATILVYQLAEKIRTHGGKADSFGLSAPLMVKQEELPGVDRAPQTFEVLRYTQPARVLEKLKQLKEDTARIHETTTELDIVLTGVGELPGQGAKKTQRGSIFYNLAKEHGFDMDTIIARERIVGDIAFTAIRSDGAPVALQKQDDLAEGKAADPTSEATQGKVTEYVFYSAVQVPVLEAMATDKNKSVILVARQDGPEKYKIPAIFASIAGEGHRYASRLVVDEETANKLCRY